MRQGSRALAMLAAGVVLLMAATLAADVVLSNSAISVVGPPTSWTGQVLYSEMTGAYPVAAAIHGYAPVTGYAVFGEAGGGDGVLGTSSTNAGVRGASGSGTGGYFTSSEGYGVYAYTTGTGTWDHGLYASAHQGFGLYVRSTLNQGIRAVAGADGLSGFSQPAGTWGVVGFGRNGGVYGSSKDYYGLYGVSANYRGIYGRTNRTDDNYGVYTPDNFYSANLHTSGAIMQVAENVGAQDLEPGDVVAFRGIRRVDPAEAQSGGPSWTEVLQSPVVQVARASTTDTSGVAGVVFSRYAVPPDGLDDGGAPAESPQREGLERSNETLQQEPLEITPEGPARSGELVLVVVYGPAEVRVEPHGDSIEPGDLLVAGGVEGCATKALTAGDRLGPLPGTVFGKALERIDPERETIYAYVTLQ